MSAASIEFISATEAAVVAGVSYRDVYRAIDEKILPDNLYRVGADGARQFKVDACVFLSFYFKTAKRLSAEERLRVISVACKQLLEGSTSGFEKEWKIQQDFLSIDLAPFLRSTREQMTRLAAARASIVRDPEILSGTPVLRGTRIPVYDVAFLVKAGEPIERILEDYPSLTNEALELAVIYAESAPARGRPCLSSSLPAGATIVSSRRLPTNRAVARKLAS
ncbi:MAG: DUF433 domain-containing protein [Terracidiphilus sp.]|jgi:uncharacterized protein (DUF433 family)